MNKPGCGWAHNKTKRSLRSKVCHLLEGLWVPLGPPAHSPSGPFLGTGRSEQPEATAWVTPSPGAPLTCQACLDCPAKRPQIQAADCTPEALADRRGAVLDKLEPDRGSP